MGRAPYWASIDSGPSPPGAERNLPGWLEVLALSVPQDLHFFSCTPLASFSAHHRITEDIKSLAAGCQALGKVLRHILCQEILVQRDM